MANFGPNISPKKSKNGPKRNKKTWILIADYEILLENKQLVP